MAKHKVAPADARRIRENLLAVVKAHYRSRTNFQQYWELADGTRAAWFHRTQPTPPSVVNLLDLARDARHRLSLDWFLLGTGAPEYRRLERLGVPPALTPLQLAHVSDDLLLRAAAVRGGAVDRLVNRVLQRAAEGAVRLVQEERQRLLRPTKKPSPKKQPRRSRRRKPQRRRKA